MQLLTKIRKLKENGKEIENKLGSYQDNIRINLWNLRKSPFKPKEETGILLAQEEQEISNEPTWRCHQNPFIGALGIQEPVILREPQIKG